MDGAGSLGIGNGSGPVGVAQARVIARLNHEIDRLANGPACAVAVIGTSSRPENVATTLRRAGRFEVEIEIPPLLPLQRKEILQLLTSRFRIGTVCRLGSGPLFSLAHEGEQGAVPGQQTAHQDDLIARLANLAVGYVAADLANLTREAALRAMAEVTKEENREQSSSSVANTDTAIAIAWEHLEAALIATRPSSLQRLQRGGAAGSSCASNGTSSHDFQSLESLAETVSSEAVRQLKTAILLPLSGAGRAAFQATNLRPSRGALLYGPAGNGKTLLAAAVGRSCTAADHVAADSSFNWIEVHAAELISAVSGESEKNVSAMFARARRAAPSILFIDELEILAPSRGSGDSHSSSLNTLERVLSVFLTQLDGIVDTGATAATASAPVVIIGATRDISAVDPAILRSGRIDTHIHIGPPDARARAAIIRLRCSQMADTMDVLDPAQIERLVEVTDGFSRADIDSLCRESAMQALREDIEARHVGPKHFQTALLRQRPVQVVPGLAR
jgi:SpoVK/Ycf46/Vps4 family AAA+-type ATPase